MCGLPYRRIKYVNKQFCNNDLNDNRFPTKMFLIRNFKKKITTYLQYFAHF